MHWVTVLWLADLFFELQRNEMVGIETIIEAMLLNKLTNSSCARATSIVPGGSLCPSRALLKISSLDSKFPCIKSSSFWQLEDEEEDELERERFLTLFLQKDVKNPQIHEMSPTWPELNNNSKIQGICTYFDVLWYFEQFSSDFSWPKSWESPVTLSCMEYFLRRSMSKRRSIGSPFSFSPPSWANQNREQNVVDRLWISKIIVFLLSVNGLCTKSWEKGGGRNASFTHRWPE